MRPRAGRRPESAVRGTWDAPGTPGDPGHRSWRARDVVVGSVAGDECRPGLVVREMQPAEVGLRVDYFHDSSDEHLRKLGVDRASLPTREAWRASYAADFARPITDRTGVALVWELDGRPVGFSSADRIVFGQEAFMHLHIVIPDLRQNGLGSEFVGESVSPLLPGAPARATVLRAERVEHRTESNIAVCRLPVPVHARGEAQSDQRLPDDEPMDLGTSRLGDRHLLISTSSTHALTDAATKASRIAASTQ